jgi:ethanolamine ammonia-lyase small subunit
MNKDQNLTTAAWADLARDIRARTPARIFVERGPAYSTQMELGLRKAHAHAVDAVWTEFELEQTFSPDFIAQWELFQVSSQAASKSEFLLRPDLGRRLSDSGARLIGERCTASPDFQIVIGDGLSVAAVSAQVPALFPLLWQHASSRGWSTGNAFVVRYCRVGAMNAIGDLLHPKVLVLLIGERPGLATAESLSAYMAYSPQRGHTDADRNLISNIHVRGVQIEEAAQRIASVAGRMMELKLSGTKLSANSYAIIKA